MRDICIKTQVSGNHKRKNLLIVETVDQNGMQARAEKKFSYYVSEQSPAQDPGNAQAWLEMQSLFHHKKERHVSIRKVFDPKTGIGQMVYRVIGSFYVVQNLHLFAVVFMHRIKFDMLTPTPYTK
ncbi:MAG: hypothetical protein HYZ52_01760 [Candidatus Omnitrophica bacterium]|nr:hypothetical protein [Candidatus Omnitrophota bacterium]